MKLRKKHKEQTELHTGPLNDILFILLFFFLIASLFASVNAMKINLPKGKSDASVAQQHKVSIDADGKAFFSSSNSKVGSQQIILDSLPRILLAAYQVDTTVKNMVFEGDITAKYGDFMKVMNMAKKLGMKVAVNITEDGK